MKLDRKTLVDYLLALGLNFNEIAELSNIPRTTSYRVVNELKQNKTGICNLINLSEKNQVLAIERKIKKLKEDITKQLDEPTSIKDFDKLFYDYRCLQFLESKEIDFLTFAKMIVQIYKETLYFYDGLKIEQGIIKNLLVHLLLEEAKKNGIIPDK